MITSEEIIASLQIIMSTATKSRDDKKVKDNDYFKRRVLGFKAEIEFEKLINQEFKNTIEFLEGGQFISKKISGNKDDKNSFIYTTIDTLDPEKYLLVYEQIAKWNEVSNLYYIKLEDSNWISEEFYAKDENKKDVKTNILKPNFTFFTYSKDKFEKSKIQDFAIILNHFDKPTKQPAKSKLRGYDKFIYFKEYEEKILKKIYAGRYFLDNIMRQAKAKQIIDLDGFIIKNKKIIIAEIKEKTPNKNNSENLESDWEYGWDTRRLLWYYYLSNKINLPILYSVRQIKDRGEREFLQWDSIWLEDFFLGLSWNFSRGGGGGEDTLSAPYSYFKNLKKILKEI